MANTNININNLNYGTEFGNSLGFFSSNRTFPSIYLTNKNNTINYLGKIGSNEIRISELFDFEEKYISRTVTFTSETGIKIFDFVSRFVIIDSSGKRSATINGESISHRSSNLYYQKPAGNVLVPIGENSWLEFSGSQYGMPCQGFEHVFYVRDESTSQSGNKWIVHHRIVATEQAEYFVLRGCNPKFEGPAPKWLNSKVPSWLHRKLFRIRERKFPNFPIMTVAENAVQPGISVCLKTHILCHD